MTTKPTAGYFIVIEGIDGAGKSTQARRLRDELSREGFDCVLLREPTDGPFGRKIRELAISGRENITAEEELELFVRDRAQNVRENINPALQKGRIVILDRYYFSTMAYQGARGIDMEQIRRQSEAQFPVPDLVLIVDIPLELVEQRIVQSRGEEQNLFEKLDYLAKVKANFDKMNFPYIRRVDGSQPADKVFHDMWRVVKNTISSRTEPTS